MTARVHLVVGLVVVVDQHEWKQHDRLSLSQYRWNRVAAFYMPVLFICLFYVLILFSVVAHCFFFLLRLSLILCVYSKFGTTLRFSAFVFFFISCTIGASICNDELVY